MREELQSEDVQLSVVHGPPLAEQPGLGALTLSDFLREVTDRYAEREALVQQRADGSAERWSYRDLLDRAVAVAKALIAGGLGKGERVGVLMTNRAEFLSGMFGTALAGGVGAPLSTFSTPRELQHLVAGSACSVLLLEPRVLKKDFVEMLCALEPAIATSKPGRLASSAFPFLQRLAMTDSPQPLGCIETWDDFIASGVGVPEAIVEARAATVTPADPGALFFSSGSTNKPKGILSAHRGVSVQLWRMRQLMALDDGVRSWTANSFTWSGNFAVVVGGTLAAGGSIVLQSTFEPATALALMEKEKVSFLFAWPHQWEQLVAAPNWQDVDLSSLQILEARSPVAGHPTVHVTWSEPRCYGNTETFTLSTGYPANTPRAVTGDSHGPPLAGNSVKIVDPLTGKTVPVGERGEVAIKGATLMLGYIGVPLDETLDDEGYFPTGDGGYIDPEGRLFWEGRLNDIIKTGGANVSPLEVDSVISGCPGVKVAQTVGIPHESLGELVVTCIVAHEGAALDEATVRKYAREKLASYKAPRRVLFFSDDDLQMTGSAKIKTASLRDLVARTLKGEGSTQLDPASG